MMDKHYPEIIRGNDDEEQQQIELLLPAGFRFHPTDEELITHYLSKKVADSNFSAAAISDVDMNTVEPWDLPWKAKIGENYEWYFFCIKDKKYPTGQRTNRATSSGYWKATGKDKEIFDVVNGSQQLLVGMKKTLVFYKGRAPQGLKTNWVSHEYRLLDGVDHLPKLQKDWVIMRVFHKTCGGKKLHISGLIRPMKPQLIVSSARSSHVPCFSPPIIQDDDFMDPIVPESIRDPSMDSAFNWGKFHGGVLSQDHENNAAALSSTENSSGKKSYQEEQQPSSSFEFEANDLDFIWSF